MIKGEIIQLRKELHRHPELSGSEYETAKRIRAFIEKHNPTKIIDNIGGPSLAAVYEFPQKGTSITIRCELDALPILEQNQFEHKSLKNGVAHKCGHDGHMAIVAGLIFWIKEQEFKSGKIILLFQSAEETGKGAEQVVRDPRFKALQSDYIFALHNIPNEPLHSVMIMDKGFSAEVVSFVVSLKGIESHAAEPENGCNPALAIADILRKLSTLNNSNPLKESFAVLTPVHVNMGEKYYGISPANGELHYTIRTWSAVKMDVLKAKVELSIKESSQHHKLAYEVNWLEYFPASNNDKDSNNFVLEAAQENEFKIQHRPYPFKFGEDFGWFSNTYKTAMFGLGAGLETAALHNASYDFPEQIIKTGMDMFKTIIRNIIDPRG